MIKPMKAYAVVCEDKLKSYPIVSFNEEMAIYETKEVAQYYVNTWSKSCMGRRYKYKVIEVTIQAAGGEG